MLIGYALVSTVEQDLNPQLDALNQAGCDKVFLTRRVGLRLTVPVSSMPSRMPVTVTSSSSGNSIVSATPLRRPLFWRFGETVRRRQCTAGEWTLHRHSSR